MWSHLTTLVNLDLAGNDINGLIPQQVWVGGGLLVPHPAVGWGVAARCLCAGSPSQQISQSSSDFS